jgi:hypothetical protein
MVELLYWLKPRLPAGYRAYIGTTPTFAIGAPSEDRPDVSVRDWPQGYGPQASAAETLVTGEEATEEPDEEIAVATLATEPTLLVEREGRLVAAVELVSPRNKDRPSACAAYASAYAGYLLRGVHLVLVDLHRRPQRFSFADQIAADLGIQQPTFPAPLAVSYRVGEQAPNGGRFLGLWRRPLTVGMPLPSMRLPLSVQESVRLDLELTYRRATEAAYLT